MARDHVVSRIVWTLALAAASLALAVLLMSLAWQVIDSRGGPSTPFFGADTAGEGAAIIQVEIRNGVGAAGLAGQMTTYLRQQGFDVVASGNWRTFGVDTTLVVDRVGDPAAAARVARALGLGEGAVIENLDDRLFVDVTVVLGHDYTRLPPFRTEPSP